MQLYNDDCLKVLKTMPDKSVDLVCTDIPYGEVNRNSNGLRNLDKGKADIVTFSIPNLMDQLDRICSGSMYIFCGQEQMSEIKKILISKGYSTRLLVWEKLNPSPMNGDKIWLSGIECCVYGKLPKATYNLHCKNTVLRYPCGRNKLHPTQKPLDLIEYLVSASSKEGDIVLDCFMGSGTTGVACKKLNREFIGIELNKEYFEIAKQRIEDAI